MIKDDAIYLEHMLSYANNINRKISKTTKGAFELDQDLKDLVVYRLQVIGEAARQVSQSFKKLHPQIEWTDIIGLRNRLVHGYLDVDYDIVWDIVTVDLPKLITELEKIIPLEEE